MKEFRLRTQPVFYIIVCLFVLVISIIMIIAPSLLCWENNNLFITITYYCVFSILLLYGLLSLFYYIEFAIIDNEKITIKTLFRVVKVVLWVEVVEIKREWLTQGARGGALCWIVIKTDFNQSAYKASRNNKKSYPLIIIANKKNERIIKKFCLDNLKPSL